MSEAAGFAGFQPSVRYLIDVGFAYIDDGARSFRLAEQAFQGLLEACLDGRGTQVVHRYPSIFWLLDSAREAEATFAAARLG